MLLNGETAGTDWHVLALTETTLVPIIMRFCTVGQKGLTRQAFSHASQPLEV